MPIPFAAILSGAGQLAGSLSSLFGDKGGGSSTTSYTKEQSSQQYSDEVLAQVNSLLSAGLTSGQFEEGQEAIGGRLKQVQSAAQEPEFNVDDFVSGITRQAAAATQGNLESNINAILSATGTSETGSSMSALLGNRLRNDAAANFAGITSQARATGQEIKRTDRESLSSQIQGLGGTLSQQILALLSAGKGAQAKGKASGTSTTSSD